MRTSSAQNVVVTSTCGENALPSASKLPPVDQSYQRMFSPVAVKSTVAGASKVMSSLTSGLPKGASNTSTTKVSEVPALPQMSTLYTA